MLVCQNNFLRAKLSKQSRRLVDIAFARQEFGLHRICLQDIYLGKCWRHFFPRLLRKLLGVQYPHEALHV